MAFPHSFRNEHNITKTTSSTYGEFYEKRKVVHVSLQKDVIELLKYVDDCRDDYIDDLRKVVAIPSISGTKEHRDDVKKMITVVEEWFKKLKVKYECHASGFEKVEGVCYPLPVVIIGNLGKDSGKKTLCIYAHLDVTSPEGENWDTDPFELIEKDKTLYGKGVAYGKGSLICWFHAIHAFQRNKIPLPVNFKFIIECMHTHGSENLESLLNNIKAKFLNNIHYVSMIGSEWLGQKYPCLIYGTAGICRFEITVEQLKDSNPKEDMQNIVSNIVDSGHQILIPHFYENVEHITPAEELLYDAIDFNFEEIRITMPADKKHWDKVQMLMSFWRLPDVAIGDDEVCTCDKKDTTTVKRGITFKVVPKQTPDEISELFTSHVFNVCKKIKCQSKVDCELIYSARPWIVDFRTGIYEAARKATIQIYKEDPNMIRLDQEIPELLLLLRVLEKPTIVLPIANGNCNAQKGNENITLRNFFEGTKFLCAFLKQLSFL